MISLGATERGHSPASFYSQPLRWVKRRVDPNRDQKNPSTALSNIEPSADPIAAASWVFAATCTAEWPSWFVWKVGGPFYGKRGTAEARIGRICADCICGAVCTCVFPARRCGAILRKKRAVLPNREPVPSNPVQAECLPTPSSFPAALSVRDIRRVSNFPFSKTPCKVRWRWRARRATGGFAMFRKR